MNHCKECGRQTHKIDCSAVGYTLTLTADQLNVLTDMCEEWSDRDRHGLLVREYGYIKREVDAFSALYDAVRKARGRREQTQAR